ncbi:nucleotidyltransferase domain-containing protein [Jiangella asiatica]|uniref:Nucleotidyltransferase domain-containing protein n=1 Tax=Jiangella asiatica TaxID=2530372 RepID=A0A4R5DY48_9ACTN|nr:nucleotidyltransferase domain-containing protein [Jiangella asiatica]TDE16063.1 nucleotidyltransferase domain-containing protein [Jiangella asiatica]
MFNPTDRDQLRARLVETARADPRIASAAATGSAAVGAEDRWSDIDLAFGLAAGTDQDAVIADWTAAMYSEHGAVDHLDVPFRRTVYRVFLLASTLQVDLAFAPDGEFGPTAPTFRLIFGTAAEQSPSSPPDPSTLIGMGWLYALHARSSIERGRAWQAEYMISGTRDHVLALACLRHGLPASQGRGMDRLPPDVLGLVAEALVRSLDRAELTRAFRAAVAVLVAEARSADADRADRLAGVLAALSG